ncbi:MAG: FxSxx-COOH system tetratricopeptide repeat protein [Verrucomicrobiia bacterium]
MTGNLNSSSQPAVSDPTQNKVFISYSRADREWLRRLQKHLKPYTNRIQVTPWSDDNIKPGQLWYEEIQKAIAATKLAVLLVSPDFLASDFIMKQELPLLIDAAKQGRLIIAWFLLKSCAYPVTPIAAFQALIDPKQPLANVETEAEQDSVMVRICSQIAMALAGSLQRDGAVQPSEPGPESKPVFAVPYENNPNFTGRQTVLTEIRARLSEDRQRGVASVAIISGLGGMGKTQTAVEYCYMHCQAYDFVFWIGAERSSEIRAGLADITRTLGLSHGNRVTQEEAVRVTLHWMQENTRWLLVLDNVERAEWLRPFIPLRGRGHILITSREQDFDIIGVPQTIILQRLSPQEAEQLLVKRTGRATPSGQDRDSVLRLLELLDYLPLAIEQAGAYMVANQARFQDYLAAYQQRRLDLLERMGPQSGDYPASVGTTWALNFSQIESESRSSAELLKSCALLEADAVPMELLGGVLRLILGNRPETPVGVADLISVDEALKPLRRYSLVEKDIASNSVRIHRLVQEVLRSRMDDATQEVWVRRLVVAANAAFPSPGFADWTACNRLFHQAIGCVRRARERNIDILEMAQLLRKTAVFLHAKGEANEAAPLFNQAIGLYTKTLEGTRSSGERTHHLATTCLGELAEIWLKRGDSEQAGECLREALGILQHSGDDSSLEGALLLRRLAIVYNAQNRYKRAERLHKRALTIQRELLGQHHSEVACTLNELAGLYYDARKYAKAENLYNDALEICRQSKGRMNYLMGATLNNLGLLLRTRCQYHTALRCYNEAFKVFEQTLDSDNPELAMTLTNLASWYRDQNNYEAAVPYLERAYEILKTALGTQHKDVKRVGELLEGARLKSIPTGTKVQLTVHEVIERPAGRPRQEGATSGPFIPLWKRVLDLTVIMLFAPVWLSLLLVISFLIKLGSRGPVFFRQERIGFKCHPFAIFKFRTMHVSADAGVHQRYLDALMSSNSPMYKLDARADPRLIPFGRFLRASALDELPQIFNVLRGEMSLVGPRPVIEYEFEQSLPRDRRRQDALPGLTGLWQVRGKNRTTYAEMIMLDIEYTQRMSLWLGVCIMARTLGVIWRQLRESTFRHPFV